MQNVMETGKMSLLDEKKVESFNSESEESLDNQSQTSELCGTLQKWTNYIHGWQERYFVLKDGCLSYFKEQSEIAIGSRGSISLTKAVVKEHEFDELRFDIGVNDSIWYCRARDRGERELWLNTIELHKSDSEFDSAISRHGSMFSLNSISSGNMAPCGKGKRPRIQELKSLTSEIETLKNLSTQLIDNIELHVKSNIEANGDTAPPSEFDFSMFRADSLTFKQTTATLLELCQQCVEISVSQDERMRARLEREIERRKRFEDLYKTALSRQIVQGPVTDGPDYQEGPHSALTEEMWYDAMESAIEKLDQGSMNQEINSKTCAVKAPTSIGAQRTLHKYSEQCDRYVEENLKYAFSSPGNVDGDDGWELMHSEGDMKVFRKEVEIDGVVMDPLKATHQVQAVSAQEICRWFFDPDVKMEWEGHLLERVKVLEILAPDTIIIQSIMKRVWPSAQRDMVFLSHIRHVSAFDSSSNENDTWIVCNYSVDHSDGILGRGVVRCIMRASMVCQTVILDPKYNIQPEDNSDLKVPRNKIACNVWYTADVNPGGWAPAKVLRQIYKHEYPKFLLKFGQYVLNKSSHEAEVTIPTSLLNKND